MKPLYPAIFKAEDAFALKWSQHPENQTFFRHIMNICQDFPSLLLAYSAETGMPEIAAEISRSLLDSGINVFLPSEAVPICAFSQSMGARQMPLGLYLDYDRELQLYVMSALTNHGGPIDEKDVIDKKPEISTRTGVLGTTDYDRIYLNSLTGFADPFIEPGRGLKKLEIPFPQLWEKMQQQSELSILFKPDPDGLTARISPDGQAVSLFAPDGSPIDHEKVCHTILEYLVKERMAAGTVAGPVGRVQPASADGEIIEVEGALFDLNYQAAFSDLLIGWWDNGVIAHQGSSCFGDGILTTIYYLEALRS